MSENQINYATVAAFERSRELKGRQPSMRLLSTVLLAVFFIVLMVGLSAGIGIFREVSGLQEATTAQQLRTGLLSNTVHMNDLHGAVGRGQGPEGDALVLTEELESGTYETRIYLYQHQIVQEYAIAGRAYNPERAEAIAESETFGFGYEDGLLTITTDEGTLSIALRSAQGGDV